MSTESIYEYGARCGVHRILRLFKKFDVKFTCYAVGLAVEMNPGPIIEMMKQGHEIASHSTTIACILTLDYRWIDYNTLSEDEEREHVRKCVLVMQKVCGIAPVGWYTGRVSPRSRLILVEEYQKVNSY